MYGICTFEANTQLVCKSFLRVYYLGEIQYIMMIGAISNYEVNNVPSSEPAMYTLNYFSDFHLDIYHVYVKIFAKLLVLLIRVFQLLVQISFKHWDSGIFNCVQCRYFP